MTPLKVITKDKDLKLQRKVIEYFMLTYLSDVSVIESQTMSFVLAANK